MALHNVSPFGLLQVQNDTNTKLSGTEVIGLLILYIIELSGIFQTQIFIFTQFTSGLNETRMYSVKS